MSGRGYVRKRLYPGEVMSGRCYARKRLCPEGFLSAYRISVKLIQSFSNFGHLTRLCTLIGQKFFLLVESSHVSHTRVLNSSWF